ncbi:putative serine/threonine-protein kinase [Zingiber officinale]|uniref:putative serine/threonine-protein kinase n=1 Tax=Zingiber officinale TaxID=94328 RepID=UPI001C4CB217|nr:putative serine/threonine-protein kinase [Zingiber officinale]
MATRSKKFFSGIVKRFFGDRRHKDGKKEKEDLAAIAATEQRVFRYETLVAATSNFSPKHKLGEGGFGLVYKGRLEDGREVAVKRLGRGSRQGAREFENEALLLSRVQHKNVVNLYGYCAHGDDKLLVYEYVPNESLDKLLFSRGEEGVDRRKRKAELDWARRYKVILGVARGLLYLHESAQTTIIHRDIKASNILLDGRWTPKIADFGMARLFPEDQTHVNTRVAGTNGYMAPEYVMHGVLSVKADVFSFGVLLLELVAGRKNSTFASLPDPDVGSLLEWAWKLYKKGQSVELLDPALSPAISVAEAEQVAMCVQLALLCTQADPKQRPDMNRVFVVLSKITTTTTTTTTTTLVLEEPIAPGLPGRRYRRRSHGLTTTYTRGSAAAAPTNTAGESSSASSATTSTTSTTTTSAARSSTTRVASHP